MGLADFETFIQERFQSYDETLDLSSGSPIDVQLIQPLLRRLGTDPFTVDAATFIITRLGQAFPDLAASDGDAITDLLTKPALLLWDPIIREIQRIKNQLSVRDPTILTLDEADALGANVFAQREQGDFARGIGRIYFAQPQPISISQANFFTDVNGQHYFPTSIQAIKATEMLLNLEGDLYYFDVNVIAEDTGDQYNIGPNQLSTIANVSSAVRVTNKARFAFGIPAEDASTFIGRIQNDLTERSLVTFRGIVARVSDAFPDVTSINVIGFNDPEMQRDVITGGGLGPIVASGSDASAFPDGEFEASTRRVTMPSADFFSTIGPVGPVDSYILTIFNAFQAPPFIRDLPIAKVIDDHTVELVDQVIQPGTFNVDWTIREVTLELSGIPGGILFPDGPTGSVATPPDQIHIGGCTDTLLRTVAFDVNTLVLDLLEDDAPLLSGVLADLSTTAVAVLNDFILSPGTGANYQIGDDTWTALNDAAASLYRLRILSGPAAGVYTIIEVSQFPGSAPVLFLDPEPTTVPGAVAWQITSEINMDLVTPKETRSKGSDGETTQNVNVFTTASAVDFGELGAAQGDVLQLLDGPDAGEFNVTEIIPPFFTQIILDRPFTTSSAGLRYVVYRPNTAGGVVRPLMRITEVDLLDTTGQPVGTTIPFAKPVDGRSSSFQNTGGGVKVSVDDAILGLVSIQEPPGGYVFVGTQNLVLSWGGASLASITVPLSGTMSIFAVVDAINAQSAPLGYNIAVILSYGNHDYIGILPVGTNVTTSSSAADVISTLFGPNIAVRTSGDIYSPTVNAMADGWLGIRPVIDQNLDIADVLDGLQAGFYGNLIVFEDTLQVGHDFAPELGRKVDVGARSVGSCRLYFLAPTSIEVNQKTIFTTVDDNNNTLSFYPDPTLAAQKIPALPNGTIPQDGVTFTNLGVSFFNSPSVNFVLSGIHAGDQLIISYIPIDGDLMGPPGLADPVPGLNLLELRLSIENQPDQFVIFVSDVNTPNAVSRQGVVDQINAAAGFSVCSIVNPSAGVFYLEFDPTVSIVVRQQNGNASSANTVLGFSNTVDTNNDSPNKGTYTIGTVNTGSEFTIIVNTPSPWVAQISNQQFTVQRIGTQRISSTAMAQNTDVGGLYYWDVDLVSGGTGDLWNIAADEVMVPTGYRSDGWYLTTTDATTTFSTGENIQIHFSTSILEVGVDDAPQNVTQLTGQSVSINYEYSSIVANVQSFISAETERVINESPLARSLVPHYVRFEIDYTGGSLPTIIQPIIEASINALLPTQAIDTGSLQKIITNNGATFVTNPIELTAVVYNFDRTVMVSRSNGSITTTRLAMFIPDIITLNQRVTG